MNIWALEKSQDIRYLLLTLADQFDAKSYAIDLGSQVDKEAIYLTHRDEPAMKAYIFTIGQQTSRYGVQLEFPLQHDPIFFIETYENLSLKALSNILSVHLDLIPMETPTQ